MNDDVMKIICKFSQAIYNDDLGGLITYDHYPKKIGGGAYKLYFVKTIYAAPGIVSEYITTHIFVTLNRMKEVIDGE